MGKTGTFVVILLSALSTVMGADLSVRPAASLPLALPGHAAAELAAPDAALWVSSGRLRLDVAVPPDAPPSLQALLLVRNWDSLLFQFLVADPLAPGATNTLDIDVGPYADGWEPVGHPGAWNRRSIQQPELVAIRFFDYVHAYTGAVQIVRAELVPLADDAPPSFRNVRPSDTMPAAPSVYGRYELRFDLTDRYANPFDSDEIAVDAEISTPSGAVVEVPCFYYQNCLREQTASSERILPQGRPEWRLRYSPVEPGEHSIALVARDRFGTNRLDAAATFTATPAAPGAMHPVRVCEQAPHFLEDTAGTPYFPIGFNIRSPFDSRMDVRFPWRLRHLEGTSSYARRFAAMHEAGLNFAEIWSSAWCMGLEWTPKVAGYHGIGQFNLLHAWERDRVFEMAAENDIRINLVLNNHGRLSGYCDPEWQDNPWNAANGGPFQDPMQWFSDERAQRRFEDILRYEIARYSWNANLFAWELWSELDLVGASGCEPQRDPAVLAWHARMAAYLHRHDPMNHLVSTHTCTDYTRMSPELAGTPGIDVVCVDAYHHSNNPHHILGLLSKTGQAPHLARPPCLVTEFGGTPNAAGINHLRREFRAALWSALPCGLSGTPMFWWWHIVEECDFYPMYAAYARFLQNEDFRTASFLRTGEMAPLDRPEARPGEPPRPGLWRILGVAPDLAYAWIVAVPPDSERNKLEPTSVPEGYRLTFDVPEWNGAVFTAEFWNTELGIPVRSVDFRVRDNHVDIPIPAFTGDLAVKIHRRREMQPAPVP